MQYYKIIGNTPIKFVIEMGLGACISEWISVAKKIQSFGGVLLYERYGINNSPQSNNARTPFNISNELHELINSISHEKEIILIAHSQGGLYAQQYARLYPENVRGLILLDPLSANDVIFKKKLTKEEYEKSGIDKSKNLIYMEKLAKFKLGWLTKKLMQCAPPLCYSNNFLNEEKSDILKSYTKINSIKSTYEEYIKAHEEAEIALLRDAETFPDIPIILITHDSEYAIEESMKYGNNSRDFATHIEKMWQEIMKEYLNFSQKSSYIQAKNCSHYIHLNNPDIVIEEIKKLLMN